MEVQVRVDIGAEGTTSAVVVERLCRRHGMAPPLAAGRRGDTGGIVGPQPQRLLDALCRLRA